MKIPKELDEKLRKLLVLIEEPLKNSMESYKYDFVDKFYNIHHDSVKALQLREEIIELISTPSYGGKYKQLDLEEEVKKSKNENY